MLDVRTPTQQQSKLLFGQVHRLDLMLAVADSNGRVNPTDLAAQLGLAQSAFQSALRDLEAAGLLSREVGGRRQVYVRADSLVWDWVRELRERIRTADKAAALVELRSS